MIGSSVLATAIQLVAVSAVSAGNDAVTIEVHAGDSRRFDTPVVFPVPHAFAETQRLRLTRVEDDQEVPVQRVDYDGSPSLVFLIRKRLDAGGTRCYRLSASDALQSETMTCRDDGSRLLIRAGDKPVLAYNHATIQSPPGIDPVYQRSGYIHPVFDPKGRGVTGDFPPDHAHQHALFFAWVNTTFHGQRVDFWNQLQKTGCVEHSEIEDQISGSVFAQFCVRLTHSAFEGDKAVPVLSETWTVRAFNSSNGFLFELESDQRCASNDALAVNEYHYGGMALRGASQWFDETIARNIQRAMKRKAATDELAKIRLKRDYLTSEGKTWIDGNGTRARWVEMHGMIDSERSGIVVMCHPSNFRAPQPVRLHPQKPYFCFAPMILGTFAIKPGDTFVSRYRYYVHTGEPDARQNESLWNDYASPPEVRIRPRSAL